MNVNSNKHDKDLVERIGEHLYEGIDGEMNSEELADEGVKANLG